VNAITCSVELTVFSSLSQTCGTHRAALHCSSKDMRYYTDMTACYIKCVQLHSTMTRGTDLHLALRPTTTRKLALRPLACIGKYYCAAATDANDLSTNVSYDWYFTSSCLHIRCHAADAIAAHTSATAVLHKFMQLNLLRVMLRQTRAHSPYAHIQYLC
jgi:hypothetical protein